MKKVIITRHMEALHNVQTEDKPETFAGSQIDTSLTDRGEADALHVARNIFELERCDFVLASPMQRAVQTAQIITKELEALGGRVIPITELSELREVDAGEFTGLSRDEVAEKHPGLLHTFVTDVATNNDIRSLNFPGGENFTVVANRLKPLLALFQERQTALIVSHANTIKVLLETLKEEPNYHIETHIVDMLTVNPSMNRSNGITNYKIYAVSWGNQ